MTMHLHSPTLPPACDITFATHSLGSHSQFHLFRYSSPSKEMSIHRIMLVTLVEFEADWLACTK